MIRLWLLLTIATINAGSEQADLLPVGISDNQSDVVWGKHGSQVTINCGAFGNPAPIVEWWLFRPATYLGRFDTATGAVYYENVSTATREK